ncbi:MAG: bifunctional folylpolyglutamate synthase/dihydrofolate synthase [Clostridiales bacterium]|nr:bifunctional folylpolyglutamate synthase/dihydrofolate synthase [Clostridiales bacterium]
MRRLNYAEALEYIHGTKKFSTKPGLLRIENLLHEMGDPHKKMKYVHIAGTNGKGSSTAMMGSILIQAGYKTGMFISPYLERFNERMQINNVPISDDELVKFTMKTKNHIQDMLDKGMLHPTEFELLTAMAFDYWAANDCDFVSLEVGMGGRLDATNVIDAPEVAMILSISFDHTRYLGNTLSEIAWEKCGIIKPGSDVVTYANQPKEALDKIREVCQERGVPLIIPDKNEVKVIESGLFGSRFTYKGIETTVPLMGEHQVYNAIGVIEAARALARRGYNITDEIIARGIAETKWVGRLEPVFDSPYCVIDAAHNPDSVNSLAKAIDTLFKDRKIVAVMGMLADKDYDVCIPEIASRAEAFVAARPDSPRALDAEETAIIAAKHCSNVFVRSSIREAVDKAFELAGKDCMVLICGSLYLIGEAKTYIRTLKTGAVG